MSMDYEKKYNEALERARKLKEMYPQDAPGYEEVFPELRESEDERIRKELIGGLMWQRDNFEAIGPHDDNTILPGFTMKVGNIIDYLRKQKEQSMSATEVLARAGLKPYKDGNQWCILAGDNIQEGICGFGDTIDEALYEFLKEVLIMANSPQLKEQKPAEWSEEDEKVLDYIIKYLTNYDFNSDECYRDMSYSTFCKLRVNAINFLKSLRPSWKPSEEQIYSLGTVVKGYDECTVGSVGYHLKEMYEQLKKLI